MEKKHVVARLRLILSRADVESDGLVNRKVSTKHNSEIEVLLENVALLVTDLRFSVEATRRELFEVRSILEE